MKMVMAIVRKSQTEDVIHALVENGFSVTFMESKGGVLRQSQQTLFISVQDAEVKNIIEIIQTNSQTENEIDAEASSIEETDRYQKSAKTKIGSSVIFIWELENVDIGVQVKSEKVE